MENIINELTTNGQSVSIDQIPKLSFEELHDEIEKCVAEPDGHCISYYAIQNEKGLTFIACLANDESHSIRVISCEMKAGEKKKTLAISKNHFPFHVYEREISENFGVDFFWHPWPKPLRFPYNAVHGREINEYPFYRISSEELHEVGVGPIHAGVIEPGHFRFICNGEMVLHLEIQLGWQHRGVETLMLQKATLLQKNIIAESIAGDTAIGHGLAFTQLIEGLGDIRIPKRVEIERSIALELERIAIHTGDLSALCTDVAYQLGSSVFGALRTPVINFTQSWCGNRFGKGLIRPGGSNYIFRENLRDNLNKMLDDFEVRFKAIADRTFNLDSVLGRFEKIGHITEKQVRMFGGVGMVARMAGVRRDVRWSHPSSGYQYLDFDPVVLESGDVMARALLRKLEVEQSIAYIRDLLTIWEETKDQNIDSPPINIKLKPNAFNLSMTEGWRGEICHSAITDEKGEIVHYKVKDPSIHNWMGLALALRNLEISDFPINNKSFDLSYCGHDL